MIRELHVKNYRSLADVVVDLDELTVLVGRNGSGKSSLVDALRFVQDALRLGLKTALTRRGGIGALRRWSGKNELYDIQIGIRLQNSYCPVTV